MNLHNLVAAAASESAAPAETARAANSSGFGNHLIPIIYGAMLLYFLYQLYKGAKSRRALADPKAVFSRRPRMMLLIVTLLIAALGVFNVVTKQYLAGGVMIALAVVFYLSSAEPVIVASNGIYGDGQFYPWEKVRRWAWDKNAGDLVLLIKERGKAEENRIIRAGKENMVTVNEKIREFKLNKPSKK